LKFKAGEPDEASDAKRACTDNEDNKCYMTKTLKQIIFPSTKIRIFFSVTLGIRIFV
jgi:hypothetical protein